MSSLFSTPPLYTHLQYYVVTSEVLALPIPIDTILGWLKLPLDDERIRWEAEETATAVIQKLEEYLGISIFQKEITLHYHSYLKGDELAFGPHRSITQVQVEGKSLVANTDYTVSEGAWKSLGFATGYLEKVTVRCQAGFLALPASLSLAIKAETLNAYEGKPLLSSDTRSQLKGYKRTLY